MHVDAEDAIGKLAIDAGVLVGCVAGAAASECMNV
jgi:hypothetical protein